MPPSSMSASSSNVQSLLPPGEKEVIPPALRRALALLQVHNLDGLEERFIATEAFLKPWAEFRDSIFALKPEALSHATLVSAAKSEGSITRAEIIWCYTQFDEGKLRYDPRADRSTLDYTQDKSVHGVIDKSRWSVQDHEKLLYVWLIQEFKVGKTVNPWGFEYFEVRSTCSAWEAVFIPVVDAVRASYSTKGRQHYGRLANLIESLCPSRLAFPEDNIGARDGETVSPTPFRIISLPKKTTNNKHFSLPKPTAEHGLLTKKHYDETEKELRVVYPQYGGLVERPKFKHKMEEWLQEQRKRAELKRTVERFVKINQERGSYCPER